ncbi:MAG: TrwC protein [Sphingomonas sp.]|nr:MAG: TrwC protein [Sphingomonas sp.]
MINLAALRSAGAATAYYQADNYYLKDEAAEASAWHGAGARNLGLEGRVGEEEFAALLSGKLPDGGQIPAQHGVHRPGLDMTFSAPKSVSLIALIGRDQRIVQAFREAVNSSLAWVEKNIVEARVWDPVAKGQLAERTGNLVGATFLHDVSRNGDPQLHTHAVILNSTLASDQKWHAIRNDKLYQDQHAIGAVFNAELRSRVEALGYETAAAPNPIGGAFEIRGVTREVIELFSTRRIEILEALAQEDRGSPRERELAALSTRQAKNPEFTPVGRAAEWQKTAERVGFDPTDLITAAIGRSSRAETIWSRAMVGVRGIGERGMAIAAAMGLTPSDGDELVPERLGHLKPRAFAAAQAVASAARELGEREAAFSRNDLIKTALEYRGPITVAEVEARIEFLRDKSLLLGGERLMTSQSALALEKRVVVAAQQGRGEVQPVAAGVDLAARVQTAARELGMRRLTPGQENAAVCQLSSADRVMLVQGGAGVGKSAALAPVAAIAREEGRAVIPLAHVGRIAREFGAKVGGEGATVDAFLSRYVAVLEGRAGPERLANAKAELSGSVIMVDEASMIGNERLLKLISLANKMDAGRLILAGDVKQLQAIEAGKPFEMLQRAGAPTSEISENLRASSPQMRDLNTALGEGDISRAFAILKPDTFEAPTGKATAAAAQMWAKLPKADRDQTILLASGRAMRSAANSAVQAELRAKGELSPEALHLTVLDRVNITREGARQLKAYQEGRIVEFRTSLPKLGLKRGDRGTVRSIEGGKVQLQMADGNTRMFNPDRLPRNLAHDAVSIFQPKDLDIHAGDRIRWTEKDTERGLLNGDIAQVERIGRHGVAIATADGQRHSIRRDDPALERIDLAYAINVHVSQGMTAKNGIMLMSERERMLNSTQSFLVAVTRIAEHASLVVDSAKGLERAVARNTGEKTSAIEAAKPQKPWHVDQREPILERQLERGRDFER